MNHYQKNRSLIIAFIAALAPFFLHKKSTITAKTNHTTIFVKKQKTTNRAKKNTNKLKLAKQNIRFENLKMQVQNRVNQGNGALGVAFHNFKTEQGFEINGNFRFFGASINKIPIVMRISDYVAENKLNWDNFVDYEKQDYERGTGILQNRKNINLPINELSKLAIVYSDNIAKNMLWRKLGNDYQNVIRDIFTTYLPNHETNGENYFSAQEIIDILKILYQQQNQKEGYHHLIENMKQTAYHNRLETPSTVGHVAHKIGTMGTFVHDAGLFFGKQEYALVVMSYRSDNAENLIAEISNIVWQEQEKW